MNATEIVYTSTRFPKLTIRPGGNVSMKIPATMLEEESDKIVSFFGRIVISAREFGFDHTQRGSLYEGQLVLRPLDLTFDFQ